MRTQFVGKALFTLSAWLVAVSTASAHFVWIESAAEGEKLLIRCGFGEPDGWDPDLIGRIKNSQFHTRTAKGLAPLTLTIDEKEQEYRATLDGPRPTAILGTTDFGAIQFGTNPASWLRYTAKNLVGDAKDWKDDKPTKELRIELLAKREGDVVALKALHLGKPLADARIKGTTPKGDAVELTTNAQGEAKWTLAGPGKYGCYIGVTTEKTGKIGDKEYKLLKDYTTLTFTINP